jgi:SET domain-containing protein
MQTKKTSAKKRVSKFTPGQFDLNVKRSVAGLGLFTNSPIKKGACVIEYVGTILTPKQEEDSNSLYLFDAGGGVTIDGAPRWNTARYINHSCRPNCEIDIYKHRVYVMAKRNIKPGEELTYDYDSDYFDAYIKPKGCRCAKCSPTLHTH